jgi:hypothetical protein
MPSKPPPVPPASRGPHEPADAREAPKDTTKRQKPRENLHDQGRQGNIAQNTTNQGYQQDR